MPTTVLAPVPPANSTIARHYDSLDPFYRDLWGEHVHHGLWLTGRETPFEAAEQMSHHLLDELALVAGGRVADIGCGYGATARLAAITHGVHVVGLTLSATQKKYADRIPVARGTVDLRVSDWREADFADGEFDALFALESLEHIADKAGFARMARRVVRPGGRVAVATWLAAENVSGWSQRHLLDAICREGRLPPLATAPELRGVFSDAGFTLLREEDLTRRVCGTWGVILRRLALRLMTRRAYWKFLLNSNAHDRVFALTSARIWLAYRVGCFRYGFYVWQ